MYKCVKICNIILPAVNCELRCHSGNCILQSSQCDGNYDCPDLSDENNCGKCNY